MVYVCAYNLDTTGIHDTSSSSYVCPSHQVENMELPLLSAQLQDCYNAATVADADDLKVYHPVVGQAYVACADDRLWYRAQALGEECMCII